jgi:hypothetical protein
MLEVKSIKNSLKNCYPIVMRLRNEINI